MARQFKPGQLQTGSLYNISSSFALTASYAQIAVTASYATQALSSSFATTAATSSYFVETDPIFVAKSGSFATTGSNTFIGNQTINGNITVNGTASVSLLYTTYETSSVIFTSGSTKFGNTSDDTHQFTGSLFVNDGTYTILDTNTKILKDQNNTKSVDWANRQLLYNDGVADIATVDWIGHGLSIPDYAGSSYLIVDWAFNQLWRTPDPGSGTPYVKSLDWFEGKTYDLFGIGGGAPAVSIDWTNRQLISVYSLVSIDWNSGILKNPYSGTNTDSLNWTSRQLIDTDGISISADWNTKELISTGNRVSIDWENRELVASNGLDHVLNWNSTASAWFSGSVAGTASYARSALSSSYAITSSYATTASYAISASYAFNATTSSYALTASYVNPLRQEVQITGSINATGSNTFTGTNTFVGTQIVTGSLLTTGSNTLIGNTILSGSLQVQGQYPPAAGSASVSIVGNVDLNGYLRFDPVNSNINSNISASYIYVSGSTQDLYFSQNGAGYNNVTRLRWLEGNLYTGLLHGGVITSASSTTFISVSKSLCF